MKFLAFLIAGGASASAFGFTLPFFDDFEQEGTGLNYNSFQNWDVTSGTVDVITGFGGNGKIVDLDGSTSNSGLFKTKTGLTVTAGDQIILSFRLRGNGRGGNDTAIVNFGSAYYESFTKAANDGWETITRTITFGAAESAFLSFENQSNDNVGLLLDEVSVAAVPEPATLTALALGGLALLRRRSR